MYINCFDEVKFITKELVKVPSVVKTSGEADCAKRYMIIIKNYLILNRIQNSLKWYRLWRMK